MGYQLPVSPDSITIAGHLVPLGGSQNLAASDLTNGTTGSGDIVLETNPSISIETSSGNTSTGIGARLNRILNLVDDFGAVGNGTVDNTTALQNAVNAAIAADGELYIPKGVFKVAGQITITPPDATHWRLLIHNSGVLQFNAQKGLFFWNAIGSPTRIEFSGIIGGAIYPYSGISPTALTGAISGTTLTASSVTGVLQPGQLIGDSSGNLDTRTIIVSQLTGTTGGAGTYQVSISQTVSSESMTAAAFALWFSGCDRNIIQNVDFTSLNGVGISGGVLFSDPTTPTPNAGNTSDISHNVFIWLKTAIQMQDIANFSKIDHNEFGGNTVHSIAFGGAFPSATTIISYNYIENETGTPIFFPSGVSVLETKIIGNYIHNCSGKYDIYTAGEGDLLIGNTIETSQATLSSIRLGGVEQTLSNCIFVGTITSLSGPLILLDTNSQGCLLDGISVSNAPTSSGTPTGSYWPYVQDQGTGGFGNTNPSAISSFKLPGNGVVGGTTTLSSGVETGLLLAPSTNVISFNINQTAVPQFGVWSSGGGGYPALSLTASTAEGTMIGIAGGKSGDPDLYLEAGTTGAVVVRNDANFVPAADNTQTCGFPSLRWSTVYAQQLSGNNTVTINASSGGQTGLTVNGASGVFNNAANFYPQDDNTLTLGTNGNRWSVVYAVNGTIQTSDLNAKEEIRDSDLGLDFITSLRPISWTWREGTDKRRHYGIAAQHLEAALDGREFGGLHNPEHDDHEAGINYSEFVAPMIRAIQELQKEIQQLKASGINPSTTKKG